MSHRKSRFATAVTIIAATLVIGVASRAEAFCTQANYTLSAPGYSYCYSSNWIASDIDPWAAHNGDSTAEFDSNWIYAPDYDQSNLNPTLLLFLPGHGETADQFTEFMRAAQAMGYYVIGLAYQNGQSLQSLCGSFPGCYDAILSQNVEWNTDHFFYENLADEGYPTYHNSINYRLGTLLGKLQAAGIAGGFPWSRKFYDDTAHEIVWSRIVVAGHSEGGATAAWIAENKPVIAALSFEAPYSMLNASFNADGSCDGTPTAPTGFLSPTYETGFAVPSNTSPVPYLQCDSGCDWAKKLHITLDSYDMGYDNIPNTIDYEGWGADATCTTGQWFCDGDGACVCDLPTWAGVNMQRAAYTLKPGQEIAMDANHVPTAATLGSNTWYTVTELPSLCTGHMSTVNDGCVQDWTKSYWNVLLASVLPPQ